uniref:BtrV protein n=1 Tax=Niallia circulans TaxID=1397 RepID=Q8GCB4_NIACI|nr:BtrV protein [Niallia circulans]
MSVWYQPFPLYSPEIRTSHKPKFPVWGASALFLQGGLHLLFHVIKHSPPGNPGIKLGSQDMPDVSLRAALDQFVRRLIRTVKFKVRKHRHADLIGESLQRAGQFTDRVPDQAARLVSLRRSPDRNGDQEFFSGYGFTARTEQPPRCEHFIEPLLQKRRCAVPLKRKLQHETFTFRQQSLLPPDIQYLLRIRAVQFMHGNLAGMFFQFLHPTFVDTGLLQIRMSHDD